MSMYNDLRTNKKNINSLKNKELVKNQKIVNIFNFALCMTMLLADILYIIKGNIVGVSAFNNSFMIISLVLEIIMIGILAIPRFNTGSIFIKLLSIVIFTLPIIAYISMFKLDGYNVLIFLLRLLLAAMLILEIFIGKNYKTGKGFIAKSIIASCLLLSILVPSIAYVASNRSRNADYSYDNELGGYSLDNILSGSAPININNGTVKINDESLKNSTNDLTFPSSVRVVNDNAFAESNVEELHISSKEITLIEALNNSKVKKVYLESNNIEIKDIDKIPSDANYIFIASKDDIDAYREKYVDNQSLFIPETLPNEYYVILNNTTSKILYFNAGEKFNEPTDVKILSSDEMKLSGWYYTHDKNQRPTFPIIVNDNIELTARWSKVYTFSFNYNGGKIIEVTNGFENSPTILKWTLDDGNIIFPTLEKENYRFDGWYNNYNQKVTMININMFSYTSFTAKFSKIYKVDYHLNDGYFEDEIEQEFIEGEANTPKTPMKLGYDFIGWYDNEELTGDKIDYVYHEGTSLYAKWELSAPTITLSNDINKVYDGIEDELSATISHDLINDPLFSYTIQWYKEGSEVEVSNYVKNAQNCKYYCKIIINYKGERKEINSKNINVDISKADYDMADVKYDESYTYEFNGKPQYPTLNNLPEGVTAKYIYNDLDITNVGSNGLVTVEFSTDSSNYNAPKSISTYVKIIKKKLMVEWDSLEFEYTGSDIKPNGTIIGTIDGYPVELILENRNVTSIGTHKLDVSISDISNYDIDIRSVEYEIVKANYDLSNILTTYEFEYDGSIHKPNIDNLPSGLVLDTENIQGLKNACENEEILIKFINNNANYNNPDDLKVYVTITKKEISATLSTNHFTYNGSVQKPTVSLTGIISGDMVNANVSNESINANQYTASIVLDNSNYILDANSQNLVYIIFKADYNLSNLEYETLTFTYDGTSKYPNPTNLPSGLELDINNIQGLTNACVNETIVLKFINNDTTNYENPNDLEVKITINPKELTAVLGNESLIYNRNIQKPSITLSGVISTDNVTAEINNDSKNAGTHIANIVLNNNDKNNYVLSNQSLTYEILKADFEIPYDVDDASVIYDGQEHNPYVSSDKHYIDQLEVTYSFDNKQIDAGTYDIKVIFHVSDNYNDQSVTKKLTISKKYVELVFDSLINEYTGSLITPTIKEIKGIVEGDDYQIINNGNDNAVNVGEYSINFSYDGKDKDNYYINEEEYKIIITVRQRTIEGYIINNYNNEYDGLSHTISVTGLPSGITEKFDKEYKDIVTNGIINITFESSNSNEIVVTTDIGYVTITKKKITAVLDTTPLIYNGNIQVPSVNLSGIISGDEVNATIINESINAGTYTANIELNNSNYELNDLSKELKYEIAKADYDLSNLEYEALTFTYNKKSHYPIPSNLPEGLTLDTANIVGLVDVCVNSDVTLKFINNDQINYNNPSNIIVMISINPAQVIATLDSNTFTYKKNQIQAPTVTITGEVAGDIINAIVTNESINAGTYTANIELDNSNYVLSDASKELTYEILKANYDLSNLSYAATVFTYDKKAHYPVPTNLPEELDLDTINSDRIRDVCENTPITLIFINNDKTNYNDPNNVLVTISIKPLEISAEIEPTSFTYNGLKQIPSTVNLTGVIEGDNVSATITNESIDAGTYTANIVLDNSNYVLNATSKALTYTIAKANYDLSNLEYEALTFTYDGGAKYPNPTNLPSGLELDTANIQGLTDVCVDGTVSLRFINNDMINYNNPGAKEVSITINPKVISATLSNEILTYNNNVQAPSVILSGVIDGDSVSGSVTNESIDAGTYTASISLNNNNYILDDTLELTYEILKADFAISYDVDDATYTYDGLSHTPYVSTISKYTAHQKLITYSFETSQIDAGEYNILITFTAGNNYNDQKVTKKLTIEKKEIQLVFDSLSTKYTGSLFTPKVVEYIGLVDGDDYKVTVGNSDTVEAGQYDIDFNYSGTDVGNYYINEADYKINIYGDIKELTGFNVINYTGVYDGLSHTVLVTGLPEGVTAHCDRSFKNVVDNAEVNITFTSSDKNLGYSTTAVGYVTITKREVEVSFDTTTLTYNGEIQAPTPIVTGAVEGENVGVTFEAESKDIGIYSNINFELNNSNYVLSDSATTTLSYEIVPCHVTLIWNNTDFTYNRQIIKPTAYVTYNDEILGVSVNVLTDNDYINVGIYQATASISDTNYVIDGSATTEYRINAKGLTLEWYDKELTYSDGSNQAPKARVSAITGDNCNVNVTVEGEHSAPNKEYTAVATLSNSNYKIDGNNTLKYTIAKGSIEAVNEIKSSTTVTYDGTAKLPEITDTKYFTLDSSLIKYRLDNEYINAGTYNVNVIFYTDNGYYNEYTESVQLIINPIELEITLDNNEFGFINDIQKPTIEAINNIVSGDDVNVTIKNTGSTIGTYTVIFDISGADAANYQITTEYTYTIVKGTIDMSGVTFTDLNQTYDSTMKLPTANNLPTGVSVDLDNSIGFTNVGSGNAIIKYLITEALAANYNVPEDSTVSITISPRIVTINWTNKSFGYDGNTHLPEYTLENVITVDVVELVFAELGESNRGSYTATISGLDNDNYQISSEESLSIAYEIIIGTYDMSNVKVEEKTLTYDGNMHEEIEVVSGLPNGVTVVSYTYNADPINVGTYSVTIKFAGDEINYNAIPDKVFENVLTINPKELTISWSNTSLTYDKTSQAPIATITEGLVSGDSCDIIVSGAEINVGSYTATAEVSNNNYVLNQSQVEQKYVISPKTINVTVHNGTKTGTSFSYNYDGKVRNSMYVTFDESDLESGDSLTINVNTSNIKSVVGTYSYTLVFSNSNYTTSNITGTVTINKTSIGAYNLKWTQENTTVLPKATYTINDETVVLDDIPEITYVYFTYTNSWQANTYTQLSGAPTEAGNYAVTVYCQENDNISLSDYNNIWAFNRFTYAPIDTKEKWSYDGQYNSNLFTANGNEYNKETATFTVDSEDVTFTKALKLESSSGDITFTITSNKKMTIYQTNGTSIKINGDSYDVTSGEGTSIELEAGEYTITKGDGQARVYAIILE